MSKLLILFSSTSLLAAISFIGCAKNQQQSIPTSRLASENIQSSFIIPKNLKTVTPSLLDDEPNGLKSAEGQFAEVNGSLITLKKSALGKAFLLSPVLLYTEENSPRPKYLLPKVVSFELNGDELALFELNTYAVYQELPSTKLLQTFQITAQNADNVTFKWAQGLSTVPLKEGLAVSDSQESLDELTADKETVLPTVVSFLKRAAFVDNRLELEQVSRVRIASFKSKNSSSEIKDQHITVQLRTTFTPYRQNPLFLPRASALKEGIGFFEIAQTRKNDGRMDIYASRWDLSPEAGPLTYAITKNAPDELIKAIKEGVLYWNQVFGREIIKVETGAEPHENPGPRRLLIYWIPWKQAGFASASIQPDPITGEMVSGAIFLTNSFDFEGRTIIRQNLPRNKEFIHHSLGIVPSGFQSALLCDSHKTPHFNAAFNKSAITASTEDPKIVLKATQDYIRWVVAHEVGHTLGLRHNFAGNMASELPSTADHLVKWKEYLSDVNHPGAVVSSTVMDYPIGRDNFLLGAAIQKKPLTYDQAAIKWGYSPKPIEVKNLNAPLFCTDIEYHSTNTLGCSTFDSSATPLAGWAQELSLNRSDLAQRILDNLISSIRPENLTDKKSVREAAVEEDPNFLSANLSKPAQQIFRVLSSTGKSLIIDRQLGGLSWLNEIFYRQQTQQAMSKNLEEIDGIPGILKTAYGLDYSWKIETGWLVKSLTDKLNHPSFGKGKTLSGAAYELTNEEIADMKTYALKIAEKLEYTYLRDLLLSLTGGSPNFGFDNNVSNKRSATTHDKKTYAENIIKDEWHVELGKLAEQIILDTSGTVDGEIDGQAITVPSSKYPTDVRLAAVRLFSDKIFKKEDWLSDTQTIITSTIEKRVLDVISPIQTPKRKKITAELKAWIQNESAILKALKEVDQE